MSRPDGRSPDQLREIRMTRGWLEHAEGSVLVEFGATRVLCAASATEEVPRWRRGSGLGWVTAEYAMLPRATNTRGDRESGKGRLGGRTQESSRPVGRALRAGDSRFVEVQGTAEREPFDRDLLDRLLDLAVAGCADLTRLQHEALGR